MTTIEDLDSDIKRYLELDAIKADIDAEQSAIKQRLRQLDKGTHRADCGVTVSVSANRRFNADKCAEIVPAELLPSIQTTVVDSKLAKAVLPPAMYEAAMIEVGEPRVTLK